jgi:hypothetical protein
MMLTKAGTRLALALVALGTIGCDRVAKGARKALFTVATGIVLAAGVLFVARRRRTLRQSVGLAPPSWPPS